VVCSLQVAQRQQQQRLLQQQLQSGQPLTTTTLAPPTTQTSPPPLQLITARTSRPAILRPTAVVDNKPKQVARINGARGPVNSSVTSTQQVKKSYRLSF
jgi:hypothetical protein